MARLVRFAKAGHPFFTEPLYGYFMKKFHDLGGMTTAISKAIDWSDRKTNHTGCMCR